MKIGDRIVCVENKNHSHRVPPPLIIGREYIIYNVDKCKCGKDSFDVGLISKDGNGSLCSCGEASLPSTCHWACATRFRKVEEKSEKKVNYVKATIEVDKPVLN